MNFHLLRLLQGGLLEASAGLSAARATRRSPGRAPGPPSPACCHPVQPGLGVADVEPGGRDWMGRTGQRGIPVEY